MLKIPATFDRFSSRSDGSFGLGFSSQEMGGPGLEMLASHVRKFGWLLFSEQEIQDEDLPKEEIKKDGQSPSTRMRITLWKVHKHLKEQGKTDEPFEFWRVRQMERMIEALEAKID